MSVSPGRHAVRREVVAAALDVERLARAMSGIEVDVTGAGTVTLDSYARPLATKIAAEYARLAAPSAPSSGDLDAAQIARHGHACRDHEPCEACGLGVRCETHDRPATRHPYTCGYCRNAGSRGPESEWPDRRRFVRHMERWHPGMPYEPPMDRDPGAARLASQREEK